MCGLIFCPDYTHERKTFVGQEITILWQDIKNTLETFSLEIFKFFSYFDVFFTLLNMFMCWLLKFENTFKQIVILVSWNSFFDSKSIYSFKIYSFLAELSSITCLQVNISFSINKARIACR